MTEEPHRSLFSRSQRHDLSRVSSCGIKVTGNFHVNEFNLFMGELLKTRAKDIYRTKGILAFEGHTEKFGFHGVHDQIDFGPVSAAWAPDEARVSLLLFIGHDLDQDVLEESLIACLV